MGLPVASYGLDKAGEAEDVQGRVEEVLFYMNCCLNCLKESFKSNLPPQCETVCKDCFREKELCDRHSDVYTHWAGDQRSCKQFRDKGLCCVRFEVLLILSIWNLQVWKSSWSFF